MHVRSAAETRRRPPTEGSERLAGHFAALVHGFVEGAIHGGGLGGEDLEVFLGQAAGAHPVGVEVFQQALARRSSSIRRAVRAK